MSSSRGSDSARMASRSRAMARSTALASAAKGALAGSARVAFTARSTAAWSGISRNRICAAATTSVHSSAPPRLGMPFSSRLASALRIVPSRRSDTVAIERANPRSRASRAPLCWARSAASRLFERPRRGQGFADRARRRDPRRHARRRRSRRFGAATMKPARLSRQRASPRIKIADRQGEDYTRNLRRACVRLA